MFRSLGILLIALSLLAGPGSILPFGVECPRCADHCPMKKPRLPCHSEAGSHVPCHSGPRLASGPCTHGSPIAPPSPELALLVPPSAPIALQRTAPPSAVDVASPEAPTLDPPLDPPRFRFAA
jgi:hypothetical protein